MQIAAGVFLKDIFCSDDSELKAPTVNDMRDTIKVPLIVREHTALRGSAGMAIHGTDARSGDHSQGDSEEARRDKNKT